MADAHVVWLIGDDDPGATAAAAELELTVVSQAPEHGFYLHSGPGGLVLQHADAPANDSGLCIDLLDTALARRRAGGRSSALARAAGLHRRPPMRVLDTTCGLGRDSATLVSLGCAVTALERHPVLYALLADALERARLAGECSAWLEPWQQLEHADARAWLADRPAAHFDLIYIDPMFVASRRKARPQKALAWLGQLVGSDTDAPALLDAARQRASQRVLVKQHARAAPLAPPDLQVRAKAVRFDIYLTPKGTS